MSGFILISRLRDIINTSTNFIIFEINETNKWFYRYDIPPVTTETHHLYFVMWFWLGWTVIELFKERIYRCGFKDTQKWLKWKIILINYVPFGYISDFIDLKIIQICAHRYRFKFFRFEGGINYNWTDTHTMCPITDAKLILGQLMNIFWIFFLWLVKGYQQQNLKFFPDTNCVPKHRYRPKLHFFEWNIIYMLSKMKLQYEIMMIFSDQCVHCTSTTNND